MEERKPVGQPRAVGVGQWPAETTTGQAQAQAPAQASRPSTATISSSGARAAATTATTTTTTTRPDPSIQISPSTPPRSHSQSQPPKSDHAQRRPALAPFRRLTASATSSSSLLTKQLRFKSSSAVPTLSTISRDAQAISFRPDAAVAAAGAADERRPSSRGRHQHSRAGSAAAHDVSATDMLKQAMMHRSVGPVKFFFHSFPCAASDNPA